MKPASGTFEGCYVEFSVRHAWPERHHPSAIVHVFRLPMINMEDLIPIKCAEVVFWTISSVENAVLGRLIRWENVSKAIR